jgi:hypothetical protein
VVLSKVGVAIAVVARLALLDAPVCPCYAHYRTRAEICSTKLGDYAQVQHGTRDSELISPTLPIRVPIAGFFAGAPDTTL